MQMNGDMNTGGQVSSYRIERSEGQVSGTE